MQVLTSGEIQYCDGAATPLLRSGVPTQTGLAWNVTAGTCTGDGNGGKLTVNASNQIVCAADQGGAGGGGSGDITDVGTCTTGACFTDANPSARLTYSFIVAPATPTTGKATLYVDSTSKNIALKDDVGVVRHGVITRLQIPNFYVTGIADDGSIAFRQPSSSDLTDVASLATLTGIQTLTNTFVQPRVTQPPITSNTITPNIGTSDAIFETALTAPTTFAAPTGATPQNFQLLRIRLTTATPQQTLWDPIYTADYGLLLPASTTGGGLSDAFAFLYNTSASKWQLVATTQGSLPARRRICTIVMGQENNSGLINNDLGPQGQRCMVPENAVIEEVTISADQGSPSVMVHHKTTGGAAINILTTALSPAAGGALACARPTAVPGYAGLTCSATLTNTALTAGDTIGLTSGTASTAHRLTIFVTYLVNQ